MSARPRASGRVSRLVSAALVPTALGAIAVEACSGEAPSAGQLTEPIVITNGQFIPGPLPGTPPAAPPDGGSDDGGPMLTLTITDTAVPILPVLSGSAGESLSGHTTPDAASVGIRLADLGTGYWIVPSGAVDPTSNDDRSFGCKANFNSGDPAGRQNLVFVAFDQSGNAGTQVDAEICIDPAVPDYTTVPVKGHTCHPDDPLPPLVISLTWDANFDVDLNVVDPNGQLFSPKDPNPYADAGVVPAPATQPFFDRDALRNCYASGYREEDLIFPTPPLAGNYLIYANPFASCGQPATTFTLTIYQIEGVCPGCAQKVVFTRSGQLLSDLTTGGASTGLFVHTYSSN
jgi:hypothetical protein